MASRAGRQAFSTIRAAISARSNVHPPRRFMSADAAHHEFQPKSDLPWIIGAAIVTVPTMAYLLKDTMAIKQKIAAGHHGHDSHAVHSEAHEDHTASAVMKDDEGTEADVSSSTDAATAADVPKAAATSDEESK